MTAMRSIYQQLFPEHFLPPAPGPALTPEEKEAEHQRALMIQAILIETIRDMVFRLYRESCGNPPSRGTA